MLRIEYGIDGVFEMLIRTLHQSQIANHCRTLQRVLFWIMAKCSFRKSQCRHHSWTLTFKVLLEGLKGWVTAICILTACPDLGGWSTWKNLEQRTTWCSFVWNGTPSSCSVEYTCPSALMTALKASRIRALELGRCWKTEGRWNLPLWRSNSHFSEQSYRITLGSSWFWPFYSHLLHSELKSLVEAYSYFEIK